MSKKKHSILGMAALAAAGAGAAVIASKSRQETQEAHIDPNYRNTERGKDEEKQQRNLLLQTETTRHLPVQKNHKV